jgi:hypothetical protein
MPSKIAINQKLVFTEVFFISQRKRRLECELYSIFASNGHIHSRIFGVISVPADDPGLTFFRLTLHLIFVSVADGDTARDEAGHIFVAFSLYNAILFGVMNLSVLAYLLWQPSLATLERLYSHLRPQRLW